MRSLIDWTDESAPQGRSASEQGNIEFRKKGESAWDGYMSFSDNPQEAEVEVQIITDRLRAKGFTVNIIEE